MEILGSIYAIICFLTFITGFGISISDDIFCFEEVLKNKNEFIKCVFMWQFGIYYLLEETINILGIIILEIVLTMLVIPFNLLVLIICITLLILKCICMLFYFTFRKKN